MHFLPAAVLQNFLIEISGPPKDIRTGAPLVGAFGWRASKGLIDGTFVRLTLALDEEERKQPECVEGVVIREMERVISAHPEQWVVLSRMWEDQQ